ncbi:unnamed protein product [Rhizophagus irregularis]|uniref:Uncharacterized protein n=1 Tax=Rhizophagus irregularis TaxID=588596 RepID=A0A915ZP78_9GLOM|nr:hypothetical protein RIR_jg19440.t1 [Rhizophagus irregularis DAOM 181602=DAOM 197198]CAB4484977.1 unnamed protein product [Rhizophagus irregularis]CAB5196098.1 unnamed protein product [Rhizophagus irregularis]CAB5385303.1 unnamed protein product [Rhizophagus irregularis]
MRHAYHGFATKTFKIINRLTYKSSRFTYSRKLLFGQIITVEAFTAKTWRTFFCAKNHRVLTEKLRILAITTVSYMILKRCCVRIIHEIFST